MNVLELVLGILQDASTAAKAFSSPSATAGEIEAALAALVSIAQSAAAAYQSQTGQAMDLSKLQPIDPVI